MTLTKIEKVFKVLSKGKEVTIEQLETKTGAQNVSAIVSQLRNEGHTIYTNQKGRKGNKYYAYRYAA